MDIVVAPVGGKADLKDFIALPRRLYAGHKGYTPHLNVERHEAFSPGKNPLFKHVDVQFFLARRGGRVVGRIAAQIDHAYLERYADDTGHFGCLVAEDDPAIFAALFAAAEGWLKGKGMKRVTGPFSLSVNEEVGLMVWGFDSRPMLLVPYDPPYAGPRVEACGYAKIKDVFAYDYDVQSAPETIGAKLMARAGMAGRVKVRTANMKMFDAEVRTIVDIFNDAWSDNWGFVPFTQAEIDHAAKAFGPVIVPDLAVIVEVAEAPVAAQDRRRGQHAGAADGRAQEVPQSPADGGGARHDGDRPAAPERQAAGQDLGRAGLDPRGQQGHQQHHPLGRRSSLQDPPHLPEGAGVSATHVPLPREGERLGEGVTGTVRNPLSPPLPLSGERRKNRQ
jgi:hypothetical protein